jgi:hypothetical protein
VSDHITVRPARPDELDTVAELWDEASRWLGSRGIDQWQYPPRRETIAHNIAAGDQCWLVEEDGRVIGTITVDECADEEFWRQRTTRMPRCTCTAWSRSARWPAGRSAPPYSTGPAGERPPSTSGGSA